MTPELTPDRNGRPSTAGRITGARRVDRSNDVSGRATPIVVGTAARAAIDSSIERLYGIGASARCNPGKSSCDVARMPAQTASAFRRALLYVLERTGKPVPMTRLHKLLYLADLQYFHDYGRSITGAKWVRHNFGPMTKAMLPSLNDMRGYEVQDETKATMKGYSLHLIERGPAPRFKPNLAPEETEALDTILRLTRRLTDDEVINLAYATTPMRYVEERERETGEKLIDLPLDFLGGRMSHRCPRAALRRESRTRAVFETG